MEYTRVEGKGDIFLFRSKALSSRDRKGPLKNAPCGTREPRLQPHTGNEGEVKGIEGQAEERRARRKCNVHPKSRGEHAESDVKTWNIRSPKRESRTERGLEKAGNVPVTGGYEETSDAQINVQYGRCEEKYSTFNLANSKNHSTFK